MVQPGEGPSRWPVVTYETLPWEAHFDAGTASRREIRHHTGPYQAAVVPRIAAAELRLPPEVQAAAAEAASEIARFDQQMGADIAPFHAVLLRSESAASSQIENLTASALAIAEAELANGHGRSNAALVVANTRAMTAAIELADQLDGHAILQMHDALMRPSAPDIAGRWRQQPVWIGGGQLGPHHAMFVPPQFSRVPDAIEDLVRFMERDDIAALAQAAVAHAQFETIHPFPDGNGRTGRALVHALLRGKDVTRSITVPVSAGLLTDIEAYFAALNAYRDGHPERIVTMLADATFAAISNGRQLVDELHAIRADWDARIKARRGAHAWRIADVLLGQPVVDAELVARELGVSKPNVYKPLETLVAADILTETSNRRRGRTWRSREVLAAVDAFAARVGRRRAATR